MRLATLALAILPLATTAQDMSPAEFETYAQGRTLVWGLDGMEYGIERYAQNRRVIWADTTGTCNAGYWEARGPDVCFVYDNNPDGQEPCWRFQRNGKDVGASLTNGEEPLFLTVLSREGAMICPEYGS